MARSVKVAVIGAGVSGLVAARELQREGHRVVVFEKNHRIGGTWAYDPRTEPDPLGVDLNREIIHSSLYLSKRTNLPRQLMGNLDYPFVQRESGDQRTFPGHEEVLRFLDGFAEEFGILELTRFESEVVRVELVGEREEEGWSVEWRSGGSELLTRETFDAVVVCSGPNTVPTLAEIPAAMARSVKVAVIGAGVSGLVAARELQREGHRVVVFEKNHRIGGTWAYDPRTEPDPLGRESGDQRTFPGHEEVLRFLDGFAEEFGILELTRFESEVVRVELVWEREEEGWSVEWRSGGSESLTRETFDAVVVCSGHNTVPKLAEIPGNEVNSTGNGDLTKKGLKNINHDVDEEGKFVPHKPFLKKPFFKIAPKIVPPKSFSPIVEKPVPVEDEKSLPNSRFKKSFLFMKKQISKLFIPKLIPSAKKPIQKSVPLEKKSFPKPLSKPTPFVKKSFPKPIPFKKKPFPKPLIPKKPIPVEDEKPMPIPGFNKPCPQPFIPKPIPFKKKPFPKPLILEKPIPIEDEKPRPIPRFNKPFRQPFIPKPIPFKKKPLSKPIPLVKKPIPKPSPFKKKPFPKSIPLVKKPIPKPSSFKKKPLAKPIPLVKKPIPKPSPFKKKPLAKPIPLVKKPIPKPSPFKKKPIAKPIPLVKKPTSKPSPFKKKQFSKPIPLSRNQVQSQFLM
ncbi:hypothetical protein K1719_013668 [Acacia pycnantha]|nr:hypothetical protein K1719_013668 [Acacia pycnantha]